METIATETRLATVRQEIAQACRAANRDAASVTLVAVSKTFGADAIEPVIAAGQRVFGENRVRRRTRSRCSTPFIQSALREGSRRRA